MDLQTGRDFALSPDPLRPWALPRGPAPDAFRPCPPDQPCAVWMRGQEPIRGEAEAGNLNVPGASMTRKKRSEKSQRTRIPPPRFTPEAAAPCSPHAAAY